MGFFFPFGSFNFVEDITPALTYQAGAGSLKCFSVELHSSPSSDVCVVTTSNWALHGTTAPPGTPLEEKTQDELVNDPLDSNTETLFTAIWRWKLALSNP